MLEEDTKTTQGQFSRPNARDALYRPLLLLPLCQIPNCGDVLVGGPGQPL